MSGLILYGMLVGFSVAAPFGPVSLACVQRNFMGGFRSGPANGFGAATAHGALAVSAAVGASVIASALTDWQGMIRIVSAGVLIWLGLCTLRRRPSSAGRAHPVRISAAYASGLLLAASNPMTILPYVALASAVANVVAELTACISTSDQ